MTCDFKRRVNNAASHIASGRRTTRGFDSCFEMSDGDFFDCQAYDFETIPQILDYLVDADDNPIPLAEPCNFPKPEAIAAKIKQDMAQN